MLRRITKEPLKAPFQIIFNEQLLLEYGGIDKVVT